MVCFSKEGLGMDTSGHSRHHVQHQHVESIAIAEFENLHNPAVHIVLLRHLLRFHYTSHYQGRKINYGKSSHWWKTSGWQIGNG